MADHTGPARVAPSGVPFLTTEPSVVTGKYAADPVTPRRAPSVPVDRDALYAEFQPLVRRLIRQYGEDPELRQDLTGEIYCRFTQLLNAYDPERGVPLRPYLVRTLTASVYTFSRSYWRRQNREIALEQERVSLLDSQSADPSAEWDSELMVQGVLKGLPEAISKLPLHQRQVVIWRYYEGRSFEEIAEALHVRASTARSLLRHGLNNLRRRIVKSTVPES